MLPSREREFITVCLPGAGTPHPPADAGSSQPDQSPGTQRRGLVVRRAREVARAYPHPFAMLGLLLVSLVLDAYRDGIGDPLALVVIVIGGTPLVRRTIVALREHRYALRRACAGTGGCGPGLYPRGAHGGVGGRGRRPAGRRSTASVASAFDRATDHSRGDTRGVARHRAERGRDAGSIGRIFATAGRGVVAEGIDVLVIVNALRATRGVLSWS